jgi:two-component system LytT family response regulator
MEPPLRVLIVDDEPLARQRIADLLAREPNVEIVGEATNGDGAIDEIRELEPDLVFLDVQMPGKSGLDVVREIGPDQMPVTIFVTAYDRYALDAFDVAAVDYLVKPFDDERFEEAFRRARRLVRLERVGEMANRLRAVLEGGVAGGGPARGGAPGASPYLERIAVESRGQIRIVPVDRIDYITAEGPYVKLHAGGDTHVLRERMQTLEERLDPRLFFRIHRSTIVRLDRIEALLRAGGGDYAVRLKDGTKLSVSRGRVEELERRLGLTR